MNIIRAYLSKSGLGVRMLAKGIFLSLLLAASDAGAVLAEQETRDTDKNAILAMVPDWLRSYPGAKPQLIYSSKTEGSIYVSFVFRTPDAMDQVVAFFKRSMESSGSKLEIEESDGYSGPKTTLSSGPNPSIRIQIDRGPGIYGPPGKNTNVLIFYYSFPRPTGSVGTTDALPERTPTQRLNVLMGLTLLYGFFAIVVGGLGSAFWIWMLVECITKEPQQGNEKIVWILIILFTHVIGAALYFLIRRPVRIAALKGNEPAI